MNRIPEETDEERDAGAWARWSKPVAFIVIILVLACAARWLNVGDYLSGGNAADMLQQVSDNLLVSMLVYTLLMVVGCVALALPASVFALLAGALFGPVLGLVACMVASEIGAVIAFVLGRYFLQDSIRPLAMRNKHLRKWLFEEGEDNAVLTMAVTRLVPLFPFSIQNFAYGITDMPLGTYSLLSFVFLLPGNAFFCVIAGGVVDESSRLACIIAGAAIALFVAGLAGYLYRHYVKQ